MNMTFEKHGELEFSIRNENILVVKGTGPWNKEVFTSLTDEQVSITQSLFDKKWGVLSIIDGDPIHTPEASQFLTELVRNDKARGRIASAIIIKDSNSPLIGQIHIEDIYKQAGEQVKCFNNEELAINWLTAKLR